MAKRVTRRATDEEKKAMADSMASAGRDEERTGSLHAGCEGGCLLGGDMPDEEKESVKKIDFSVLTHSLPEVGILGEESLRLLSPEMLLQYAIEVGGTLLSYVAEYKCVAVQLANAAELILNGRVTLFGRSSERTSTIFGKDKDKGKDVAEGNTGADGNGPDGQGQGNNANATDGNGPDGQGQGNNTNATDGNGTGLPEGDSGAGTTGQPGTPSEENGNENGGGKGKGRPRRKKGCMDRGCAETETRDVEVTISDEELDEIFGKGNWRDLAALRKTVKEYRVIPAKIVAVVYHLHVYGAVKEGPDDHADVITAPNPVERTRPNSRLSSGILAYIYFFRNILRMPVNRVRSYLRALGLVISNQCIYENLKYYDRYFSALLDRMWTLLLTSRCIQADETPVRYYDKEKGEVRRGYLWVFTTGELLDGNKITLFYFAEGRGADVLREVLGGFKGILGSDGHSAYHVFARESGGSVTNAGCLDHFRKRVVRALRAVPGLKDMTEEEKMRIPAYAIMKKLNAVFLLERKTKELRTKEEREELREEEVQAAFKELVKVTLQAGDEGQRAGSYTDEVVKYMKNQEVYLEQFLYNGDIAVTNSECERKFAFFAVLRSQVKMFGSFEGARVAGNMESIAQTARGLIKNMRIYYQYLFDRLIPFVRGTEENANFGQMEEMDQFMPWSSEYTQYEKALLEKERQILSVNL